MDDARQLRIRIALLLAASGAVALPACGGNVVVDPNSTSTGAGGVGGATGSTTSSTTVTTSLPLMCPGGGAPTEQCLFKPDIGCEPASSVEDGCCNPATFGPIEKDGLCCYGFCETSCCGRAFTVAGRARVAPVTERGDWRSDDEGALDLDATTRAALASAWLADAQMEHASIASFARFTLELMAAGAPSGLVAASQRAALDEVEHARSSFGLASRFEGRALGPAALDVGGALPRGSLAACAASAAREGCIGETIAALTARAQLARAEDDGARRALTRIAEDEEAHAELAWRFVAWAIATGGDEVRAAVGGALEAGVRRARATHAPPLAEGVHEGAWGRFGRLTPAESDEVTARALDEIIAPCAAMLRADRAACVASAAPAEA